MRRILYLSIIISVALILALIFVEIVNKDRLARIFAPIASRYKVMVVKSFPFSESDALKEWEEKVFSGRVSYNIEKSGDLSYVRASSVGSASALYYKINMDIKRHPVLKWKWRVEKFPAKKNPENIDTISEHDFAGRVYVIFPAMFILNSQVLEYIWAEKLPVGSTGTSPYSRNIKLMVLESGTPKDSNFVREERDIMADYLKMFGNYPQHNMGAVAFMTNAEHTKTSADALYDEIEIGYKEE